jgi:hypothetical protein
MRENEFSNQLDWLAFCYIADELNEEQRNAFEMRLAEDQQARDAVVQAMEQSQLLFVALTDVDAVTTIPGQRRSSYRLSPQLASRLLAFAAALLLMTTGLIWLANSDYMNSNHPPLAQTHSAGFDAEKLAFAWADSLDEISEVDFELPADEDSGYTDEVVERAEDWMFFALEDLENTDVPTRSDEGY